MKRTSVAAAANRLRRNLAALWDRSRSRPSAEDWRIALDEIVADLENLNDSTERDFLAVGGHLMEFLSTARKIAADMAELTDLISGEQGSNAAQVLTGILERSHGTDLGIEQNGQTLGQVHDLSTRIRQALGGLGNSGSVFRSLCTLTRIETSRLGNTGADFGALAAEVGPLSESIQLSGEKVLEVTSRLDESIQTAIRSASDLHGRQLTELPALIGGVINSLHSFEERRRRAAELSARQAAQSAAMCDSVDGMVRSVQFHDITRQQVEHVVQALRALRAEGESGHEMSGRLPQGARSILALQSSQLAGAARVFAESTEHMERDLESIAAGVQETAGASKALMGVSSGDQNSFFLEMESQFTAILEMLGTCASGEMAMEETAAGLQETIGRMRDSIEEIRSLEIRIHRIAINGTIRAVHIGEAGSALGVIAEAMQRLAIDSRTTTEDVSQVLDAMSDGARSVSNRATSYVGSEQMGESMRRTIVELHSLSERSYSRVTQIATLGAGLAEDIRKLRLGLSAGALFSQVVQNSRDRLSGIGAMARVGSLEDVDVAPAHQLQSLAEHYTMQMERDVHQSVAGCGSVVTALDTRTPEAAPADGDLGDNVELF